MLTVNNSIQAGSNGLEMSYSPSSINGIGIGCRGVNMSNKSLKDVRSKANVGGVDDFAPNNKFGDLIKSLREILGSDKGLSSDEIDINKVMEIMNNYKSDESEWGPYALNDPTRGYTRNGIVNINNNANLLILVWNPERGSAIHDHANAHCCMKILKGELVESLYEMPQAEGAELSLKKETIMSEGHVGYISDKIGLHKMYNPNRDQIGVSLHLYTPPYASLYGCCTYDSDNGEKHRVDMSKYFSWQGKVVNAVDHSTS